MVPNDLEGNLERSSPDSGVGDRTEIGGGLNEIDSNINTCLNSGDRTEMEWGSNEIDSNQSENSRAKANPPDSNINPISNSGQLESEDESEFTARSSNGEHVSEGEDAYRLVKYKASEVDFAVPDSNSCAKDLQDDSTQSRLLA